jgi:ketosteroid isomerase-like protein
MSSDAEAWIGAFTEGWRRPADADEFSDPFEPILDPQVRLVQPRIPAAVGRAAFRELFARPAFTLIPDLHADVHDWAVRGDTAYVEFTLRGTLGGRPIEWRAVDRLSLRDGLLVERRSFFDPAPVLLAVATRPRAWPRFLRAQAVQLRARLRRRASRA